MVTRNLLRPYGQLPSRSVDLLFLSDVSQKFLPNRLVEFHLHMGSFRNGSLRGCCVGTRSCFGLRLIFLYVQIVIDGYFSSILVVLLALRSIIVLLYITI